MLNQIARKLAVGAVFIALVTPAAFANSPMGTDPEPKPGPDVVHIVLVILGLA